MNVAKAISERSTCTRRKVGAVLVKGKVITATGYNGNAPGEPHCVTCPRENYPSGERLDLCTAIHAEPNALMYGEGDTLYIYGGSPCITCAGMIIRKGIRRVVYSGEYPQPEALARLYNAGVMTARIEG